VNPPTKAFKQASLVDSGNRVDTNSDNALSVFRCVNGVCHGILNRHKAVERVAKISVAGRFTPGTVCSKYFGQRLPVQVYIEPLQTLVADFPSHRLQAFLADQRHQATFQRQEF
jgi:hypothetical protein